MEKSQNFVLDKEHIKLQLNDMKKQGYTSICCMTAWLQNEYRSLSIEDAIDIINEWIDEYKIKHEHLVLFKTKSITKVMTESEYNKTIDLIKQLLEKEKK